ncbi:SIR2-like domain-containing protein [Pedobacter suwonensis]|uniref:SIR2-like domain-containing protein n=1 Tax=Pedobacter suwonensis TaxID=332999 RepID=A0A1I0SFK2_9SPHI|nr:SIR2 family protein [Pedobacter suwonensis]SFA38301.1 SIR2-like domain-containing protein [Pedobacter suwonensis]
MATSMILGAGFSYNAGLPLVSGISEKFLRDPLEDQILFFGSGEWKWVDWANHADMQNGRIQHLGLEIGYFISYLIKEFQKSSGEEVINYEKFYQFVIDKRYTETEKFEQYLKDAELAFKKKYPISKAEFSELPDYEIFSCIYHLIEDLLWVRLSYDEISKRYSTYINFFKAKHHQLNIFTLNHDLLLERIFDHEKISYCDGFSTNGKILLGSRNQKLPVFSNSFYGPINVLKLHGSIDLYKYNYIRETNRYKGYDYFKTLDYRDKHYATDVDDSGKVVQNFTPQIVPQFITGASKMDIINSNNMYRELYERFSQELIKSEKLIIIGYSYQDDHINSVIEKSLKNFSQVININPGAKFPFEHQNIHNLLPDEVPLELLIH